MPLPDQTPKLPKLPFVLGDAAFLAGAWFIAAQAPHPLPLEHTLAIVGCVLAGGLIGVIPFLTDYARRQDEALDDRQRGLEALARTVAASAEQISIAAQGLQEIAALAQKNLQETVELPAKLQDKMTEFRRASGADKLQEKMSELSERAKARAAEKEKAEKEWTATLTAKAERLEAVAEQIAKGASDWAKADAAFQKMLATLEKFPGRSARSKPEASAPTAVEPAPAESVAPPPAPVEERKPEPPTWQSEPEPLPATPVALEPAAAEPAADSAPTLALDIPAPVAVAKPPRKPRKPRAEPAVPEPSAAEPEAPAAPAAAEFSQVSPEEAAPPPAVSSDGATRLLVTAYIGIGNRLFIRGEGPGLSWEKGVPLQFVSIGKWRWETSDASAPIRFKLYKNDEIECAGLGEGTLESGRQQELTAAF